jgi:hypothetical protein
MATNKHIIHGVFGDEEPLLEACKKLRAAGIRIKEVFSPMPIHGIAWLGYRASNRQAVPVADEAALC